MHCYRSLLIFFVAASLFGSRMSAQILPETTTDYLNIYKIPGHDKSYQTLIQAGAKVINFTADTSFACVWVPPNYSTQAVKRVMVSMHGTKGAAYDEMKDEIANGQANNYAVIGIQWWVQGATPAADGTYLEEEKIYRLIDTTLKHMQAKYGSDLSKVGYEGLSRGSAISYAIMFLDKYKKTNYFALSISHSGGIPLPPGVPKPLLAQALAGVYGKNAFLGTSYFMYCGLKDEEWGTTMCDQMSYADSLMKSNGGQVVRRITDPNGLHAGYHTSAGYQASAVQWFLDLTSTPTQPALRLPTDKATQQPLSMTLQWSTNATASLYDVQVSTNSGFTATHLRDSLISANITSKQLLGLAQGTTYYWRVRSKNNTGAGAWSEVRSFTTQGMTSIGRDEDESIKDKGLQVSPNPASDDVHVRFILAQSERVSLKLYNVLGQEIASLLDAEMSAGEHNLEFSAQWATFKTAFLRLQTRSNTSSQILTVIR